MNEDALKAKLTELHLLCNRCLKRIPWARRRDMGAVNWADLHCAEAGWVFSEEGESRFFVEVSEASPDASGLCSFVAARLARHGWKGVEVRAEW